MARTGRPCAITQEHDPLLVELAQANPQSTLVELATRFQARTGLHVHPMTFAKALKRAGVVRVKPQRGIPTPSSPARRAPYGYTEAHRQQRPGPYYPSGLTDAEWALVADLFEHEGERGKPPRHLRRHLLEACCYVVRNGCSWRMLPRHFPHWDNVYKTFRRWSAQGKFEQMHDRLRAMWRQREAREVHPGAAILEAQSTRISPQGGQSGFDAGKRVKGRKRSPVVDTLGLLLSVSVCAVSLQDRDAGQEALEELRMETQYQPAIRSSGLPGAIAIPP
jgi:transposase